MRFICCEIMYTHEDMRYVNLKFSERFYPFPYLIAFNCSTFKLSGQNLKNYYRRKHCKGLYRIVRGFMSNCNKVI